MSPIITTIPGDYVPIKPLEERTVHATIHQFPSLEPLRFMTYPANHLYLPTRKDILHRAVIYEGDMTRLGTASTKTRHEIRGSARKIRPQKGSGRARLGDKKSHMLRGGGVAFGPKPRDFATELPKKVYDLAWRTALSYRFRKGELIIVDNAMEIESPSTRLLDDIFAHHDKLRGKGRSLLVTLDKRPLLEEALKRMDRGGQSLTWEEVDVKNLLEFSRVIIERNALHNILRFHQQDITHTPPKPSHLVKSSPPTELENTIGWAEFRDLQLLDAQKRDESVKDKREQAARAAAGERIVPKATESDDAEKEEPSRAAVYELVAAKRYEYALTLPSSSPQRTDLTISVYNLTAEAKMLYFTHHTGLAWSLYATDSQSSQTDEIERISSHRAAISKKFPAVQNIDYQMRLTQERSEEAERIEGNPLEQFDLELAKLQVKKYNVLLEASVLAAQVHEHIAEAKRLAGADEEADIQIEIASLERGNVDAREDEVLSAQLRAAELEVKVLTLSGRRSDAEIKARGLEARVEGARAALVDARGRSEEKERERAVLEDGDGDGGEVEELEGSSAEEIKASGDVEGIERNRTLVQKGKGETETKDVERK